MKEIYSARDSMEAHFLKGLLEGQGIAANVQGEALSQVLGELPLTQNSLPTVWVADEDVTRALPIVEELRQRDRRDADLPDDQDPVPTSTWTCPKCGERVEQQFTDCWKCGTARPGLGEETHA
jgi:hypothetical protein